MSPYEDAERTQERAESAIWDELRNDALNAFVEAIGDLPESRRFLLKLHQLALGHDTLNAAHELQRMLLADLRVYVSDRAASNAPSVISGRLVKSIEQGVKS